MGEQQSEISTAQMKLESSEPQGPLFAEAPPNPATILEIIKAILEADSPKKSYVISSSGPIRSPAPLALASRMLVTIRFRLPSKSSDHWFKAQVATTMRCPILSSCYTINQSRVPRADM